jgi:hypothetical protein
MRPRFVTSRLSDWECTSWCRWCPCWPCCSQ